VRGRLRTLGVALVHYPVKNRQGESIATAITNLDLHDISRSALTFGASAFFIVHPVLAQRTLVERLVEHWTNGPGGRRVEDRRHAMAMIRPAEDLDEALLGFGPEGPAELWVTSAESRAGELGHDEARGRLAQPGPPVLLAFGTGWGLSDSCLSRAQVRLAPVFGKGPAGYNHLSVRAAAAILLDRLTLERSDGQG
jgi:hypothetical protein